MKKAICIVLVLAMALSLFAGCGSSAAPSQESSKTVEFTDDCGRTVTVPENISRIVPTGPLSQIVLFALCPEMFVGLASKWSSDSEGIIPEEFLALPYFGQLYGSADLNIESLALAAPQIIIDIGEVKKSTAEDVEALQSQLGIPCVFIESTLESLPETYRKLGALLGLEERAETLASFCEKTYDRTLSIMEQIGDNKAQVICIPGYEELSVLAKGSYHAEIIDLICDNAAVVEEPSGRGTGNSVSMEQLALWDSEYVIFGTKDSYASLETDPAWEHMRAVKEGKCLLVPTQPQNWLGSPPGAQRILGLIWLTAVLYPEYCDFDVKEEVKEFYELFFHCTLSDEQFDAITENAFLN